MPRHATRQLDLSAAQTKAKAKAKPLTDRQVAEYERALAGLQRWLRRSLSASTQLKKYQSKVSYYEKLTKAAER